MNHPYAPFIVAALGSAALAALTLTWSLIRRDHRENALYKAMLRDHQNA